MRLSELLQDKIPAVSEYDCDITGLSLDSRTVRAGHLFFAVPGALTDGRQFINTAIDNGAVAIVAEGEHSIVSVINGVPVFTLPKLAQVMGIIAARFYQNPSHHLQVIAVTGTNGKTSCCHFIAQALELLGYKTGVLGTLGNGLYGHLKQSALTTPEPIALQALLAEMQNSKVQYVAMEAASHGLVQGRLNGVQIAMSVFTNLTRDHLDYHGDMASYAAAKRLLFNQPGMRYAVINADDEYGQQWLPELTEKLSVYSYSLQPSKKAQSHNINEINVYHAHFDTVGITASIHTPWGEGVLHNPYLVGHFNLSNLLAVLTVLGIFGIPLQTILACLAQLRGVPGRMETLRQENKPLVVVDYAHTPDALEKVLRALKEHCRGKLWCVFGCGGNRDRGKRPLMGKVAEQHADYLIVTDDNPRYEDPRQIVTEILQGITHSGKAVVEHDRRRAIAHALACAQVNDIVLIAGKGHESYQIIGEEKLPFNDVIEAQLLFVEEKL